MFSFTIESRLYFMVQGSISYSIPFTSLVMLSIHLLWLRMKKKRMNPNSLLKIDDKKEMEIITSDLFLKRVQNILVLFIPWAFIYKWKIHRILKRLSVIIFLSSSSSLFYSDFVSISQTPVVNNWLGSKQPTTMSSFQLSLYGWTFSFQSLEIGFLWWIQLIINMKRQKRFWLPIV